MSIFIFFSKNMMISLIKNYKRAEQKVITSQSIKLCKIIVTCYEIIKS
jgi:hypothetical protein